MITNDFSKFGKREFEKAIEFLEALRDGNHDFILGNNEGLEFFFNQNSGDVYLLDEEGRYYWLQNGELFRSEDLDDEN